MTASLLLLLVALPGAAADTPGEAEPGRPLRVRGTSPIDGRATVELVRPRDRPAAAPPPRNDDPEAAQAVAEFQETYRRANDDRLAQAEASVAGGRMDVVLPVPKSAHGPCTVRVFIEGS